MDLTLRQLEYVVALAETLSFREAAERCFVTQPALSKQVQLLERLVGVMLFERQTKRRVVITPAGAEVVQRAREVLTGAQSIESVGQGHRDPLSGPVRLGIIPTIAPYLLPRLLPLLARRHPRARFIIHEGLTTELVALTTAGELDASILALESDLETLQSRAIFEDAFCIALPSDHPLAGREKPSPDALKDEEILLLADGHCFRDQALSLCSAAGAQESTDFRAASLPTLVEMVAAGTGITLLPELALVKEVSDRSELRTISFKTPAPHRTIGLAWRQGAPFRTAIAPLAEAIGSLAGK